MLTRSSSLLATASLMIFSATLAACASRPPLPNAAQIAGHAVSGKLLQAFHWRLTAVTDDQDHRISSLFPQADRSSTLGVWAAETRLGDESWHEAWCTQG